MGSFDENDLATFEMDKFLQGFECIWGIVFLAKSQPRKMHSQPMIYNVFEEGESASPDAYKHNAFPIIWVPLWGSAAKITKKHNAL